MGQYLDKFTGTISQQQTQQVLKLLNKKRNQGQIRNLREFSQQLEELMQELSSTTLQPTTKLFLAIENELISAEQFNFMLDRVEDDLVAAFAEANSINTVQESHEALVRDVILKNLRSGIAELESKINLYEILNRDANGFDAALFSTFRESKDSRTNSGSTTSKVLFLDPRNPTSTSTLSDASVELIGERLVLGTSSVDYYSIKNIKQLFASEVPQSAEDVNAPQTSLENIIDNTKGTYWIQNILVTEKQNYVKVKLELDFGIRREINFIEIEPAIPQDLVLEAIQYVDNSNTVTEVSEIEVIFDGPASFKIRKIQAQKLILTFRNEHFTATQFEYKDKDTLFTQALNQPAEGIDGTISLVSDELEEIIPSEDVRNVIGVNPLPTKQFNGYEFTVGIDNIRAGLATYNSQSIYVSKPIEVAAVGQIGLRTDEIRPYKTASFPRYTSDTYTNAGQFLSSIEYWVIKRDYNADGSLIATSKFPILPLGVSRTYHERLVLTEKSDSSLSTPDTGLTMFMSQSAGMLVYRNGILLTDETGNPFASDGWQNITTTADKTPSNNAPMRTRIKVLSQLSGDIFTISYDVGTSNTRNIPATLPVATQLPFVGLGIVDLVGNLSAYAEETQLITINEPDAANIIDKSEIYLAIVLRRNSPDASVSAGVEEYTLMVGKQDITKYEGT